MDYSEFASAWKRRLRRLINEILDPLNQELVRQRLAYMPHRQLQLAFEHFGIDLVIDVGANTGQFAKELFSHSFHGEIISIEPLSDAHTKLVAASRSNRRWKVLDPVAAGRDERTVDIQVAGNSVSSSIMKMLDRHVRAAPESATVRTEKIRQNTLDALVFNDFADRSGVMIKIDTQGYEYEVMQGAQLCMKDAKLVLLELSLQPLYAGQTLWLDMISYMRDKGYLLWAIQPEFCDPQSGQVLQVNGIFNRSDESN